jgi:MoaA/NifB/PqqE/SkfB family radical SAM enzyme
MNGLAHQNLRKDISENKRHTFCNRCWVVEDGGGHSYRQNWNDMFFGHDHDSSSFTDEVKVEYLEMTLGNKCNIQCRMCNPWSSNMWADDVVKHPELNHWEAVTKGIDFEWYDSPEFDKLLDDIIPTVKHINMLGGEPLFNTKYYEILQRIIDSGRASEVSVQFNTNLLALQDKNFDLWKEFKWINANISCDGVEGVNEYVRYPGKWSKFIRNLDKVIQWQRELGGHHRLRLQIHSTMSSLTWLDLGNLFNWCQTLPLQHELPFLIQVNQPSYMDCIHMPNEIKQLGYDRAKKSIEGITDWQTQNIISLLDHVMNTERDLEKWNQMIVQTNRLDRVRNSSILNYIPEYKEFWNDSV